MTQAGPTDRSIKSDVTVFGIVEALNERAGAGVVELADHLDMAQSTVHDHLSTLQDLEYVVKRDGKYFLGLKFLELGISARSRIEFLETVKPEVGEVAEHTGEVAWLYTEEHGRGVVVYKARGEKGLETVGQIGWRPHLHYTSAGKSILAAMSDEEVDAIVDQHGLPQETEQTITDREELFAELETIRERGYAVNREEKNRGISAVGVPLRLDDRVLGALSVSGPSHRLVDERIEEAVPNLLLDVANQIELKMKYQ